MAKAQVKAHVVNFAGKKYLCAMGDEYGEIGSIVGIEVATDQNVTGAEDGGDVADLIRSGKITRLRCSGKDPTTNKNERTDIYVAADKVGAARAGVIGKTIKGTGENTTVRFKINRCYFPTFVYRR